MQVGDKATVDIKPVKKPNWGEERLHRTGRIHSLTDKLITIEYLKDGKPTYKDSFNISDVIEEKAIINVCVNRVWTRVSKKDFEELIKNE